MAGTVTGGIRAAATNKEKFGNDFYVKIGALGGQQKVRKGFAVTGLAREAGSKGGKAKWKRSA